MTTSANRTPRHEASARAYVLLTVTALCWGGNAVLGRLAVGEVSPMVLVALRWLGVLVLLLVFASRHVRRDWPAMRPRWRFLLAMGALGFAGFNALFYLAAHWTSAVNLGIVQGSMPAFVLLGAFAAYRTRVTALQILGATSTMIGVATVGAGGDLGRLATLAFNRGDVLMVIACVLYAGYAVALQRRPAVSSLGLLTVMAGAALIAALPLVLAEAALGQLRWPTATGWVVVALVTVFPSFLAQIFFIQGVALIGPGRAGLFVNLVPVFAPILAVAFLKETFALFHAVALCLVLGGIWVAERGKTD